MKNLEPQSEALMVSGPIIENRNKLAWTRYRKVHGAEGALEQNDWS